MAAMVIGAFLIYRGLTVEGSGRPGAAPGSSPAGRAMVGRPRPDFGLRDLGGHERRAAEWNGKVLVVNFWATWCPPCRREIPAFIDLQEKYGDKGLQLVGIAIDEPGSVKDFVEQMRVNYPTLIGDADAIQVARSFGNHVGALPYTVIVDRDGRIALTRAGELSRSEVEAAIHSLL